MTWQPIESESPPKDQAVWIYCDDGMRHVAVLEETWDWKLLRYNRVWKIFWPEHTEKKLVTHWMPLPDPPMQS